jgi:cytochrome c553
MPNARLTLVAIAAGLAVLCAARPEATAQPMALPERIKQCGTCHGEDGVSTLQNIPSLAGQPEFFIMNQLFLMREGVRKVEPMAPFVKDLKDDDLEALAAHYARLTPKPSPETIDPDKVERGAALAAKLRCASCHMPTLSGHEQMPRLAKQRIDYMIMAMKSIRDDKRAGADTLMAAAIRGVSDEDLAALAHYAASR